MDGTRLRAHNQYNTEARLFIEFLSLIIQSEIIRIMRDVDLFKTYSVREFVNRITTDFRWWCTKQKSKGL
jgi:hypothetical protein